GRRALEQTEVIAAREGALRLITSRSACLTCPALAVPWSARRNPVPIAPTPTARLSRSGGTQAMRNGADPISPNGRQKRRISPAARHLALLALTYVALAFAIGA